MTDLNTLIAMAKELNASDVHIVSGLPVRCRVDGSIRNLTEELLTFEDCENYGRAMAGPRFSEIEEMGELDLAQSFPCGARTRINLFRQQGSLSAAIRLLAERIPELEELNLPPVVASFPDYRSGIVLGSPARPVPANPQLWPPFWTASTIQGAPTSLPWKTPSNMCTTRINASSTSARSAPIPIAMPTACAPSFGKTRM